MNEINKILLSVVLFIVGTALSLMTSNFIISTGACFILGLLLNRPKRMQQKAPAQTRTLPSAAFARTNAPSAAVRQRYSSDRIMNTIRQLRDNDRVGYVPTVQNLRMVDDYGNYWSLGVRSLKWYVSQGGEWIQGQPSTPMRISRGSSTIFDRPPALTAAKTLPRPHVKNMCSFCGEENEMSSAYCMNCGHEVGAGIRPFVPTPVMTRTCDRCGASVKPGKRFCTRCGNPIQPQRSPL